MKPLILTTLLAVAVLAPALTQAQTTPAPSTPPAAGASSDSGADKFVDHRLERLTKMLTLTDDQQAQIKPILADEFTSMKAVKDDSTLADDAKKDKMKTLSDDAKAKISAILTPDQQQKFAQMKDHQHDSGSSSAPAPAAS